MIDIKLVRDDPAALDRALARRGLEASSSRLLGIDAKRRAAQTELQTLQARRNEASKEIGKLKRDGGNADAIVAEIAQIKDRVPALEAEDKALGDELDLLLATIPNLPAADVPDGRTRRRMPASAPSATCATSPSSPKSISTSARPSA